MPGCVRWEGRGEEEEGKSREETGKGERRGEGREERGRERGERKGERRGEGREERGRERGEGKGERRGTLCSEIKQFGVYVRREGCISRLGNRKMKSCCAMCLLPTPDHLPQHQLLHTSTSTRL